MATLAFVVLISLSMAGQSSGNSWCICKGGLSDMVLQRTLDYACGAGADCNPLHPNGACFQPNTVRAHCSYAVNSYFQKKQQVQDSCDFAGTATLSASDPSITGCSYPSTASPTGTATGTSTTIAPPTTATPSTPTNPTNTTPSTPTNPTATTAPKTGMTANPYTTMTPAPGVLGGIGTGSTPTGVGNDTDDSDGGLVKVDQDACFLALTVTLLISVLFL